MITSENREVEKNEKWTGNEIRNEGAHLIIELLKINTSLKEVNIRGDEKIKKNEKRKIRINEY